MPVVSITASVTVAKIKPTNFSPLRSAIVVPWSSLPLVELEQLQVHNKLPGSSFRIAHHVIARHDETKQSTKPARWLPDCFNLPASHSTVILRCSPPLAASL